MPQCTTVTKCYKDPFRVVLSEKGTWQKDVDLFIAMQLHRLKLKDSFNVRGSQNFSTNLSELNPDFFICIN